jgi:opacity protein-like surface antigen
VDVDDHGTFGGRVGFLINRSFEIELQYSRTETHFVTQNGGQLFGPDAQPLGDLNIDYLLSYMTFNFGHNRYVIPYITLGAGAARLDPTVPGRNADSETRFTASLGGGVRTMFTRNFGLRFDGRIYTTLLDNNDNNNGCDNHHNNCHNHNNNWLTNGDVTGGLVFAF